MKGSGGSQDARNPDRPVPAAPDRPSTEWLDCGHRLRSTATEQFAASRALGPPPAGVELIFSFVTNSPPLTIRRAVENVRYRPSVSGSRQLTREASPVRCCASPWIARLCCTLAAIRRRHTTRAIR